MTGALDSPPPQGLLKLVFNRRNVAGVIGGLALRAVVGGGSLPVSILGFVVARWAYGHAEQHVPFTNRRHVILLPTAAEVMLGQHWYDEFLEGAAKQRSLLDREHPDTLRVTRIAQRLVAAVTQRRGGGYQKHVESFQWQVSVVDEPVCNAFVFSGGKIVVYVGLLDLLGRDDDLVAMVMGHEIAHALARHQSEKMGLGLGVSVAASILLQVVNGGSATAQQRRKQQEEAEEAAQREAAARARRGYHRTYSRLVREEGEEEEAAAAARARQRRATAAAPEPGALPPWMSEQLMKTLSTVLLELPLSRRAETEADLIGLKLMALAGFNASKGPTAFERLADASGRKRHGGGGAGTLLTGLGCTHPDSQGRAVTLRRELEWMGLHEDEAVDAVGMKVDYWATGAQLP